MHDLCEFQDIVEVGGIYCGGENITRMNADWEGNTKI